VHEWRCCTSEPLLDSSIAEIENYDSIFRSCVVLCRGLFCTDCTVNFGDSKIFEVCFLIGELAAVDGI
jgi:hypothetical protein